MEKLDFIRVNYPQPHLGRREKILKKYPEVKKLFGHTPSTAIWTVGIVALQFSIAIAFQNTACAFPSLLFEAKTSRKPMLF